MPVAKERLQKALEKLARLTNEIDNQRTRAPPGTIERAIDAAPVLGFDDDVTTEEAVALRAKNETRRRLARELKPLGRC
jgi:HAMP domain-containing protein